MLSLGTRIMMMITGSITNVINAETQYSQKQSNMKLRCEDCGNIWEIDGHTYSPKMHCPKCQIGTATIIRESDMVDFKKLQPWVKKDKTPDPSSDPPAGGLKTDTKPEISPRVEQQDTPQSEVSLTKEPDETGKQMVYRLVDEGKTYEDILTIVGDKLSSQSTRIYYNKKTGFTLSRKKKKYNHVIPPPQKRQYKTPGIKIVEAEPVTMKIINIEVLIECVSNTSKDFEGDSEFARGARAAYKSVIHILEMTQGDLYLRKKEKQWQVITKII